MSPEDPKTKTILVVEDDEGMQGLFEVILQKEGFKVMTAGSAEEAMKRIAEKTPDLIVLDFMLPGKGGYETIRELQGGEARETPIIIATARRLDARVVDELKNEPNVKGFFAKPVQPVILAGKVHEILNTGLASNRAGGPPSPW